MPQGKQKNGVLARYHAARPAAVPHANAEMRQAFHDALRASLMEAVRVLGATPEQAAMVDYQHHVHRTPPEGVLVLPHGRNDLIAPIERALKQFADARPELKLRVKTRYANAASLYPPEVTLSTRGVSSQLFTALNDGLLQAVVPACRVEYPKALVAADLLQGCRRR